MARSFRVSLYTPQRISQPEVVKVLWEVVNDPLIDPQKFDTTERARKKFDPRDHESARELYAREGMLFVRGAKDGFTAMFMSGPGPLSLWNFWWDVKSVQKNLDRWLEWIYRLCGALPPYFGSASSVQEYDSKHVLVEADSAGSSTRVVGVSFREFKQFLPGVYWLTIFGSELAEYFGGHLETLPGTKSKRLSDSLVAVLLEGDVVPHDMEERLRIEAELAEILGAKQFFDRTKLDVAYKPVPGLVKVLES